jgi:hypothetical protein
MFHQERFEKLQIAPLNDRIEILKALRTRSYVHPETVSNLFNHPHRFLYPPGVLFLEVRNTKLLAEIPKNGARLAAAPA